MTDQLPERFYGIPFKDDESPHWLGQFWSVRCSEDDIELLRADTAIPRSQADAMVAAAVKQARYIAHIAWGWPESEASSMPVCEAISEITPADARAAFEQAVREAEQRGWARGMEAKVHNAAEAAVREAVEAERERLAGKAMEIAVQIEVESTLGATTRAIADVIEAAIRAPQETSE